MINLEDAVARHAAWKIKFRTAISKQELLDVPSISRDDCCDVGKWLHGDGRSSFGTKPEFQGCVSAHRHFHLEAGKVAELINARAYARAEAAMDSGTPFAKASSEVATALVHLKRTLR